jgi:hypothetical protein
MMLTVSAYRDVRTRFGVAPLAVLLSLPLCAGGQSSETAFLAENDAAMNRMMNDMSIRPSGSIDRDFAVMMIPHHQGAIDMARAELRYGSNERMRRIAQGIVVEQQQEIAAMQLILEQELAIAPPSLPLPSSHDASRVHPPMHANHP